MSRWARGFVLNKYVISGVECLLSKGFSDRDIQLFSVCNNEAENAFIKELLTF